MAVQGAPGRCFLRKARCKMAQRQFRRNCCSVSPSVLPSLTRVGFAADEFEKDKLACDLLLRAPAESTDVVGCSVWPDPGTDIFRLGPKQVSVWVYFTQCSHN